MEETPLISVILPVYNAELYLREAIDSILNQTVRNFELIIINDGSSDRSSEIVRSCQDSRIIYIEQANMGLAATLNKGISIAKGEFIARQDNDDVSAPDRFEKQIAFMLSQPSTGLLGSCAEIIDENGNSTGRFHDHPTEPWRLKFALIFNNPIVHSTVMIRKSVLGVCGTYLTDTSVFEDHNLWSRIARFSNVANLPDRLLRYREVSTGMSRTTEDYMRRVKRQCIENIFFYCPALNIQNVENCAGLVLGIDKPGRYNESLRQLKLVMTELALSFSEKEKIAHKLVKKECFKQVLAFKRHYYNGIIESPESTSFQKFVMKMRRKLMFIIYKPYF